MPPTVLIVEDDPPTRKRLESAVAALPDLQLLGSSGSANEARAALRGRPDVMLVDLGLPDGSGVDLIREARRVSSETRAMVITVFADEDHVLEAIKAGAQGYLLKDGSAEYIGRSIEELLAGGSPISPAIARYLLQSLQQPAARAARAETPLLTDRELEILNLVAKGFSVPEVGELLGISGRTVTTHVQHIYRKLEVSSRSEAIFEAVNLGLIDLKS
ncbi:MAG TPA: response regulator transcription factor [Candidatus Binatia bacterium]|nr:response regulator transcription factor [Candidatus Binatia bacterium]